MVLGEHLREESRDPVVAGALSELADQERSEPTTLNPIADADAYLGPHVVDPEVLRSAHHRSLITAREREERDVRRWIDVDGLRGDLAHVDHRGMEPKTPALRRQ